MPDTPPPVPWRAAGPTPPGSGRRRLILAVLLLLVCTAGVTLGVLYWFSVPREPAVYLFAITTEPGGTPVPWAEQDRAALAAGGWLGRAAEDTSANPTRDQIRLRLKAAARVRRSQPVVVYLSAPAGVDDAGTAYLLPADPVGDHPRNRVPLADLLALLRDCPARHKLLVLNLTQPAGAPPGELSGPTFRALDAVPDPDRLCLVSCAAGQVPQAAPSLGRTVFGYYLEAGLRGAADGWNPDGARDGRVTVRELAAFVRERAERWPGPQSPTLVGTGADFPVRVFPLSRPDDFAPETAPLPTPEPSTPPVVVSSPVPAGYPDWLAAGWERRDRWLAGGRAATAPFALARLGGALRAAERAWLGGRPAADVRRELDAKLAALEQTAAALAAVPTPDPLPTLAAVRPTLAGADRAVLDELKAVLARDEFRPPAPPPPPGTPPAPLVLPPEFDALKAKPHAVLAVAAFDVLADSPPSAARVRRVAQLLAAQEPTPRFAETLLVARLARLAESDWPGEPAAAALRTARAFEDAAGSPEVLVQVWRAAGEAYRLRADAEAALFAPGFVSAAEVDRRTKAAADAVRQLKTAADALRSATGAWDEAAVLLATAGPAVEAGLVPVGPAVAFADAARELAGEIDRQDGLMLDAAAVAARVPDWQRHEGRVREAMAAVTAPFRPAAVRRLIARAEASDAAPGGLTELDAVLDTQLLPAADRVAVVVARLALARRLGEAALLKDRIEDESFAKRLADPPYADPTRPADAVAGPVARPEWWAAVQRAGGVPADLLAHVGLRWLRAVDLAGDFLGGPAGLRLALFAPASLADPLANPDRNLTTLRRRGAARALWAWHAARFEYEWRDVPDLGSDRATTSQFARACRAAAPGWEGRREPYLELAAGAPPALSPENPRAAFDLAVRLLASEEGDWPVEVRVSSPAEGWVRASGPAKPVQVPALRAVPVRVEIEAGERPTAFPGLRGLFAEAAVGGRTFHARIPVGADSLANRLDLLVSTDPKAAPNAVREVRLRPNGVPVPHYLVLSNPSPKPRTVVARLAGMRRETPPLALAARDAKPLVFPPPAPVATAAVAGQPPAAPPEFDDFAGPLEIELLDPDTKTVLQTLALPVRVADPSQYLTVQEVRFDPAGSGKPNRLAARVVPESPSVAPGCVVEMAFPAGRNPGLAVRDGNLRAPLPAGGAPLSLYTENLLLTNPGGAEVVVTFSADGSDRAFSYSGILPTLGLPVRLTPLAGPMVRVKAPEYAPGSAPLPVTLEVDNAPDAATVELRLGTKSPRGFVPDVAAAPQPAKRRAVGVKYAADGAMVFRGTVADPKVVLPVELLAGRRTLEARLLDRNGAELAAAERDVTFDITPPTRVRFVDPPPRAPLGKPLALAATSDLPVSGIKEVKFFVGKPVNNGPPPSAQVIPGRLAGGANVWEAVLPPVAAAGPVAVGVQFVSKAGLPAAESTVVEFVDPAELAKPQPAKVSGTVVEGAIPQPGLDVVLFDEKGAEKARKKTGPGGAFAFPDLPPGRYILYTAREATGRAARQDFALKPGEDKKVSLALLIP